MAAKGTAHETCLRRLLRELPNLVGQKATLQCQAPISILPQSEPEPDFAIVKNREDDYISSHPTPDDVLLLMEVSDSTLTYDQETKLSLYAQANISHYWIFNLLESWLEAYSEPYQINAEKFGYAKRQIVFPHQTIKIPCFSDSLLDLSKIFP
jgi:Uma2 family endonuclease